jgi:hypothetical protein
MPDNDVIDERMIEHLPGRRAADIISGGPAPAGLY